MQVFFSIGFFVVGLVQLFAIASGIQFATDISGFLSFIIAGILTYIPLIGSVAGVYGAVNAWDWNLLQAVLLFFWFVPVGIIFFVFTSLINR